MTRSTTRRAAAKKPVTVQVILTDGYRQRYTAACLAALKRRRQR